ncbi:MAG: DNA polymerase III subunit alpha [Holophagaceae bacterium]|nr:DNA polymerase III subunit alpha [Holophagaceae bacterium]
MSFALGISDFSAGEGIYPAELLIAFAERLGYTHLAAWDTGLHGFPTLRDELAWRLENRLEVAARAPALIAAGVPGAPDPELPPLRLLIGSRFMWKGRPYGALPCSRAGYAALNKLLTEQAHGQEGALPADCAILAEDLPGLELLLQEGVYGLLLGSARNAVACAKALAARLPVVAPQVLRFRTPEGLDLHRLKRAIHTQSTVPRTEALWDPRDAAVPKREWESRFPAAEPAVARATEALRERVCGWDLSWGSWVSAGPLGIDPGAFDAVLAQRVRTGVIERFGAFNGPLESRLAHELDLIHEKGFAAYFLLVEDLVKALKHKGLPTRICGRGSGAASLVSYALHLSNVDPVATNLMFERFLTKERVDPPDMDIDFAWDERDEVIAAVFERYGKDRVAMVANHVFFKPRSALRAVAMAHGRPDAELKSMAKRIEGWGWADAERKDLPALMKRTSDRKSSAAETEVWQRIQLQATRLVGHFHQLSVHPGGTVVTPGPLWEHAAFQPAPAKTGVSITQWDKDGVEAYGLVKIDLLGNRSLAVIRDAYEVLGDKVPKDPGTHSRNDPETQALLARGDSIGVFYVESPATRQLQQRVGKGDFETLVIHSSLIRPAAYHWVDRYVKRVRGEEAYTPSHPVFANLLSESFGVLIYQEDVIKVGVELAGWSHFEADQLRKLLGKPDCARKLPKFEARFREGCAGMGVPAAVVEEAWDMIRTFRGYSFCKPHSASYAQVSFESAWVKTHHPAVFFASVISNQGGFYPAIAYLGDARRHRLTVRGPDANRSLWKFSAEGEQGLRVGLMQVKGARKEEVEALLSERDANGPFASLEDLLSRMDLSITTVEALASAGAFDLWAPDGDRTRLVWTRLGGVPPNVRPRPTDLFDRADLELDLLSLTLELHPAALYRVRKGGGPDRAADAQKPGRRLRFWALVVAEKTVLTEKGEPMQFVTLEDETGLCECVAFPDTFRQRRRPYRVAEVLPVQGLATRQDGLTVVELQA